MSGARKTVVLALVIAALAVGVDVYKRQEQWYAKRKVVQEILF